MFLKYHLIASILKYNSQGQPENGINFNSIFLLLLDVQATPRDSESQGWEEIEIQGSPDLIL